MAILKAPWAQIALWLSGVVALLTGASESYGSNWGLIVVGTVFVAAAISLAFLRVARKKVELVFRPPRAMPLINETESRRRRRSARLVFLALVAMAVALIFNGTSEKYSQQLRTYEGVTVNTSRKDVQYLLGYPPIVFGDLESDSLLGGVQVHPVYYTNLDREPINALPAGTTASDYSYWLYEADDIFSPSRKIDFDAEDRVLGVSCADTESSPSYCSALFGVRVGDTEEELLSRLGAPTQIELDGIVKTIRYSDIGAEFRLTQDSVYYLELQREKGTPFSIASRYFRGWFSWW